MISSVRRFSSQIYRYLLLVGIMIGLALPMLRSNADKEPSAFLIGWYGGAGAAASLDALSAEQGAGANVTVIYNTKETSADILKSFLDAAAHAKIKVIVQVPEEWIADRKAKVFNPDLSSIQTFVKTYKAHPALYAWYLFDEPEYELFPTGDQLQSLYGVIKQSDPDHPIAMSFGDYHCWNYHGVAGDSHVEDYVMASDLILFDQYPIFNQAQLKPFLRQLEGGVTQEYHRLEDIPFMIDNCTSYLKTHHTASYQGFIPILQGFKWGGTGNRYPTYSELRYMVYASLVRDIQGITFWNNYWNAGEKDKQYFEQSVAYPLLREARSLSAVVQNGIYDDPQLGPNRLLSGPTTAVTRDAYLYSISYKFGNDGKNQYLIAVNDSRQTQSAVVFTLPSSVISQSAEVLFEDYNPSSSTTSYKSRVLPLVKNNSDQLTLTDTFTPFQVHVYNLGLVSGATVRTP